MIYSSEDDKEFGFEIAIMEDVLKAKKYKKAEGELKILGKKKKVSGVSNISSVEDMISLLKAASFILGNESDGDGFGKVSYDLAAEMIFEEVVVDAEIKTASAILDFMKKNKTMLNKQDAGIKKYVTEKKSFLVDKFIEKLAFDAGSAFNATVRVLPSYLKTKNEMKETLDTMKENGISRVNFVKNHMIGNGFGELMKMQVQGRCKLEQNVFIKIAKRSRINPLNAAGNAGKKMTAEGFVNGAANGIKALHGNFTKATNYMSQGTGQSTFGQKIRNKINKGYNDLVGDRFGIKAKTDHQLTNGDNFNRQFINASKTLGAAYRGLTGRDTTTRMQNAVLGTPNNQQYENNPNHNPQVNPGARPSGGGGTW